jgi:hypothetical protein
MTREHGWMTLTYRRCQLSLAALLLLLVLGAPAAGQQVIGEGWIYAPGLGSVNVEELPEDLREAIAAPRAEPAEEPYADLPPQPAETLVEDIPLLLPDTDKAELPSFAPQGPHISLEEVLRRMYEQRSAGGEPFPDDVYQKAWEHIQKMPAASPEEDLLEPQSWFLDTRSWLTRLWRFTTPRPLLAQAAQWVNVGPAPFRVNGGTGQKNAGIVTGIEVDP